MLLLIVLVVVLHDVSRGVCACGWFGDMDVVADCLCFYLAGFLWFDLVV